MRSDARCHFTVRRKTSEVNLKDENIVGHATFGDNEFMEVVLNKLSTSEKIELLYSKIYNRRTLDEKLTLGEILDLTKEEAANFLDGLNDGYFDEGDKALIQNLKDWLLFLRNQIIIENFEKETITIKTKNYFEYLELSGIKEEFRKAGFIIYPTHDCSKLIFARRKLFLDQLDQVILNREEQGLSMNEADKKFFLNRWLANELAVIDRWQSDKYPSGQEKHPKPSPSELIELDKYREYILNAQTSDSTFLDMPEQEDSNSSDPELLQMIQAAFEEIEPKLGWRALFHKEDDFLNLSQAIYTHFKKEPVSLPSEIELKKRKKSKIAITLGSLHKNHSKEPIFRKDETFFDIVRTIKDFQNEKDLAKTLKR